MLPELVYPSPVCAAVLNETDVADPTLLPLISIATAPVQSDEVAFKEINPVISSLFDTDAGVTTADNPVTATYVVEVVVNVVVNAVLTTCTTLPAGSRAAATVPVSCVATMLLFVSVSVVALPTSVSVASGRVITRLVAVDGASIVNAAAPVAPGERTIELISGTSLSLLPV